MKIMQKKGIKMRIENIYNNIKVSICSNSSKKNYFEFLNMFAVYNNKK